MSWLKKLFGDANARYLKTLQPTIAQVNALEAEYKNLSAEALKAKTAEFREKLAKGESLDALAPQAFAAVREAASRTLGMRHYDVQLLGGLILHKGQIAEMRTGEGKTLTATTAVYLNALEGKGAHVVTVNEYLAKRDAVLMGQVYHALGMSVGIIQHNASFLYNPEHNAQAEDKNARFVQPVGRKEAYAADITYGTNNEYGFDFLRDNMAQSQAERVQRDLHFAIVDEVDSILIDEARTPLIISAPAEESSEKYATFAGIAKTLKPHEDYSIDEKLRAVSITESGIAKVEQALGLENLYEGRGSVTLVHHLENALKAQALYKKDKEYVVKDGEIVIVDEFTGRMLAGRRYSEGLHQAIEAKEGVKVQNESLTLATVTFQNYFRLYKKLSGMTGTALTEAEEFTKIYKLDVTTVPTHKPMVRLDHTDRMFKSEEGKFRAVVAEVKARHEKGQPMLIGTVSIEKNEYLGALLERAGVPFKMLNAKNHASEAEIIAQAGRRGAVTIATNMAGRGVDILLGGNPQDAEEAKAVRELGGLCVIGTERHESRRIDNQLRGRAGRQGDPGESIFFVSLEDDLMRIFNGDRAKAMMNSLGVPEDMPIESGMVTRLLEQAQRRVEGHNFDIRKHLLEYDDVLNKHREVFYTRRKHVVDLAEGKAPIKPGLPETMRQLVMEYIEQEIESVIVFHTGQDDVQRWNLKEIEEAMKGILPPPLPAFPDLSDLKTGKLSYAEARTRLVAGLVTHAGAAYDHIEKHINNPDVMRMVEKSIVLRVMDSLWVEHLQSIDHLRAGIGLQSYGQHDPLVEYKRQAYRMFTELLALIQKEIAHTFFRMAFSVQITPVQVNQQGQVTPDQPQAPEGTAKAMVEPSKEALAKAKRNDECPCGSGKKFKNCHGA